MKTIHLILLSLLLSGNFFSQVELQHEPLRKEYAHEVFSYNDGSFSILTSNYVVYGKKGRFVTYNAAGEVLFENNNINVTDDGLLYNKDLEVFVDSDRKEVLFLGHGTKGIVLRKINHRGKISDIIIRHKETPSLKNYLRMSGSAWTGNHTLSVVVSNILSKKNDNAVLITFNTENSSYVIKPLERTSIKDSFGNLIFVGEKETDLVFLGRIPGEFTQSEVVRVQRNGIIHSSIVPLVTVLDENSSKVTKPVLGGDIEYLYFSLQTGVHTYVIYKISADNKKVDYVRCEFRELQKLEEAIPKKWLLRENVAVPLVRCASFCFIQDGDQEKLAYSLEGYNIVSFVPDWDFHRISTFDPENYIGPVQMSSLADLELYLKKVPALETLKEQIVKCNTATSSCVFTVRAIHNPNGETGFIVISGDKIEERGNVYANIEGGTVELKSFHYENVKITKY